MNYCITFYNDDYYIQADTPAKAKYKLYQHWRDAGYEYNFRAFLQAICGIKEGTPRTDTYAVASGLKGARNERD